LACASFDATVSIWESANGEFDCVATLEGHENEVKCVAWDSRGSMLATCSRDKSVWIWATDADKEFECVSILNGHTQDVKVVRWHPHEPLLVSGSYDDTIRLWHESPSGDDEWECAQTLTGHTSTVWDVAFDASGQRLVSCSDDLTVRVWQPVGGKWQCVCTLQGYHTRTVFSVDVSTSGLIATGSSDNHVRIFAPDPEVLPPDGPSFRLLADSAADHPSDVNCVRWNPRDASILATACDDGALRLWRVPAAAAR
jgi:WD40 repeat protein